MKISVDSSINDEAPAPIPLKGIRRTIARRMTQAWAVPAFHVAISVDMSSALDRRADLDRSSSPTSS